MNFCWRREKHPILLQNKHNRGCVGSSSHQGQQALWGPDTGGEMEAERLLSQVFSKSTMSESNYSRIKDKDVTWEGAATQRLTIRRGPCSL